MAAQSIEFHPSFNGLGLCQLLGTRTAIWTNQAGATEWGLQPSHSEAPWTHRHPTPPTLTPWLKARPQLSLSESRGGQACLWGTHHLTFHLTELWKAVPQPLSLVCSRPSNVQWMGNFPVPQFLPLSMWTISEPSCPQGHQVQRKGPTLGPMSVNPSKETQKSGASGAACVRVHETGGRGTRGLADGPAASAMPSPVPAQDSPEAPAALLASMGLEHRARCSGVGLNTLKDFCFYSSIFRNL